MTTNKCLTNVSCDYFNSSYNFMVQTLKISIGSIILGFDGILYFIISLLAFSRLKGPNHLGSVSGSQPNWSIDFPYATPPPTSSFKLLIYRSADCIF